MASLKDVARKAKVSIAAASMALRDHPKITEETRSRVKAAADALEYRPSAILRQAMSGMRDPDKAQSHDIIAVVVPDLRRVQPRVRASLERSSRRLGYRVEFVELSPRAIPSVARALNARNILGALLLGIGPDVQAHGPLLFGKRIRVLSVQDMQDPFSNMPRVGMNLETLARIAVWQSLQRGYQRPGLLLKRFLDPGRKLRADL